MRELINHLEDMELTLRNMQGYIRGESWPSRSLALMANDVIVWLGLTASAVETLKTVLEPLEEAKEETPGPPGDERCVMEPGWDSGEPWTTEEEKEEKGGEDIGEQVSEPEGDEVRPETPVQEPDARPTKGRKRLRDGEG